MAQFVLVPPLKKIALVFKEATGKQFGKDVSWSSWFSISAATFEMIREYYRPCHIRILEETISGKQKTPCTLLRQLLRPYHYVIRVNKRDWSVHEMEHGITKKAGVVLDWS